MSDRGRSVAVIGLGAMGLPMAERLAEAFSVNAFDPEPTRTAAAARSGARAHASPAGAVAGAEVVLLAVRDQSQVESVLFGEEGIAPVLAHDAVVLVTSTIGPAGMSRVADRLAPAGVIVDAPVSGGPVRARRGDLLIMVSGTPAHRARAQPVLGQLSSTLTVVGDSVGAAQTLKVVNQLLAGVHIAAAAEAIALAGQLGLDPAVVVDVLGTGAASSFMLSDRGPRMLETVGGEPVAVRSRLDIFVKDMGIVTDLAREAHVATPLASAAQQLFLLAETAGLGPRDDSSVIVPLRPAAG